MATLSNTTVNNTLTATGNFTGTGGISVGGIDVKTKLNLIDTLNTRLTKIVGQTFTPTVTKANGSWTISDASAYLVGNCLRVYFSATRSAAVSGNITNEDVVIITINTGGKVGNVFTTAVNTSSTGGNASWTFNATSTSGNITTVTVRLAAVQQSGTEFNAIALMPVRINPSAY